MKQILTYVTIICLLVALAGCGGANRKGTGETNSYTNSESESNAVDEPYDVTTMPDDNTALEDNSDVCQPLFDSEYIPVACHDDRFIVRNDSGNLYGVVNEDGNSILPCEYEKISFENMKSQTVLKVMSKGSYGIFDLNGIEHIPCEYTDISVSTYTDFVIVKNFFEKMGLLDLQSNVVLPIEADVIRVSYDKGFVVAKNADEEKAAVISVYDCDMALTKEYSWDKDTIFDIVISNGGNLLCVNYGTTRNINIDYIAVEGPSIMGDTHIEGKHLFYFNDQDLIVRNLDTQEEKQIWSYPEDTPVEMSSITTTDSYIDPITGYESVDINFIASVQSKAEYYSLRITFGDTIDIIDLLKVLNLNANLNSILISGQSIGQFYGGEAIVFPQTGYLYTINTKGEKIAEITNPYTDRYNSAILPYAVILNNNGYYSIINSKGETLLSDDGYSNIQKVNVNGVYLVTNQQGEFGHISKFLEVLAPCGSIDSMESGIEKPSYDKWNLEAKNDAEMDIYIIHNEDKWALYDDHSCKLITDFMDIQDGENQQYQQVLGNNGYLLISEDRKTLYLVSCDDNTYSVYYYVNLDQ